MPKRQLIGVVKSDKMNKSRRVEIERLVPHAKYGKFLRRRTVCHVHDENNESHEGDTVEIIEAPPRSKLKRWDLLRIVSRCQQVDIAAMRAAAEGPMKGILFYCETPLVSADFNGTPYSSILDSALTRVLDKTFCKVLSWYDNEWGFSNRMRDLALLVGRSLR